MFRVAPPPIIRSAYNYIYSIWYLSHRHCYLPLSSSNSSTIAAGRLLLKCDGTRAATRFRLYAKRTSPFKSAGESVQSTTGRPAVHISLQGLYCSCASLCSAVMWRLVATHPIRQFPHQFSSRASPCTITFQTPSSINGVTNTRCCT